MDEPLKSQMMCNIWHDSLSGNLRHDLLRVKKHKTRNSFSLVILFACWVIFHADVFFQNNYFKNFFQELYQTKVAASKKRDHSCTPDWGLCCFYPYEKILSHKRGKDTHQTAAHWMISDAIIMFK